MIGDELALAWSDGAETFFPLETLRRNCPCAVCQGEADVMGHVERPERTFTAQSFTLRQVQNIGGYALQPYWADGHSSGLYSFRYLRELGAQLAAQDAKEANTAAPTTANPS
jgi:DUF971 family protein